MQYFLLIFTFLVFLPKFIRLKMYILIFETIFSKKELFYFQIGSTIGLQKKEVYYGTNS